MKPTETLISLLYQSVSIRDSRHSIQLGVSSTYIKSVWEEILANLLSFSVEVELDHFHLSAIDFYGRVFWYVLYVYRQF